MRKLTFLLILGLIGCGGVGDAEMADVSGTITFNGKPLVDADVFFVAGDFEGYGRTDKQGHYVLTRGAPVGKCKVYITKVEVAEASSDIDMNIEGMDEEQLRAMAGGDGGEASVMTAPLIPSEYSDPEKTKLTITVPAEGTDKANFKL